MGEIWRFLSRTAKVGLGAGFLLEAFEKWKADPQHQGDADADDVGEDVFPVVPAAEVVGEFGNDFGEEGEGEGEPPLGAVAGDDQDEQGEAGEEKDVGGADAVVDFLEGAVEEAGVAGFGFGWCGGWFGFWC